MYLLDPLSLPANETLLRRKNIYTFDINFKTHYKKICQSETHYDFSH